MYTEEWDAYKMPLFKPYGLIKLTGPNQAWEMNLEGPMISVAVHNVKEVNVLDSVLLIHSGPTQLRGGEEATEAWFIIVPKDTTELGYSKEKDFRKQLRNMHIGSFRFLEVDTLYAGFLKSKYMDWSKIQH